MSKWIDLNEQERMFIVNDVAAKKNIEPESVEKDWWVTIVLKALFEMNCADYLLFKGGTSLSKGWGLINRFSEDIDIAINKSFYKDIKGLQCAECRNNNQIKNLRKANRDYILGEFADELDSVLRRFGLSGYRIERITMHNDHGNQAPIDHDKDPACIMVHFPTSSGGGSGYLSPHVKVEVSGLSMSEPFENKHIRSIISEFYPDDDTETVADINTVSPTRTFLEKAFLLNEEFQRINPRTRRQSRHLYDLEHLMDTEYGMEAIENFDLYKSIVKHREKFYHVGGVDYYTDMPDKITFVPKGDLLEKFRADYQQMKDLMIFNDKIDFDYIITRLEELQKRFRAIKMDQA